MSTTKVRFSDKKSAFKTITLYNEKGVPLADILLTKCLHTKRCNPCRYQASVRVFRGRLTCDVYDYPTQPLPPYLQ